MKNYHFKQIVYLFIIVQILGCSSQSQPQTQQEMPTKINKTETEWKTILTDDQYRILREKGTEYPGTGEYYLHFEQGTYVCAGCKTPLFASDAKFESHCGWPSFDKAIEGKVEYKRDTTHGMIRTEILCATCGGHLGHVFDDGTQETTGQRFCVNSLSIDFQKKE